MDDERHEPFLLELKTHKLIPLPFEDGVMFAKLGPHTFELQRRLNPDDELRGAEGFRKEFVSPRTDGLVECVDVTLGGKKEDRNVDAAGEGADPAARLESVDVGHANVEKDAIRRLSLKRRDGRSSAARHDDAVAFILERALGEQTVRLVVVHDEDGRRVHRFYGASI
jgi:hypothetical protein